MPSLRAPQKKEPGFAHFTRRWKESCYEGLKVLMSQIEFALSSSGQMCDEDSSTLPEQEGDKGVENRFVERDQRCQVVLEPAPPSYRLSLLPFHLLLISTRFL
jgi:hypothetical protein